MDGGGGLSILHETFIRYLYSGSYFSVMFATVSDP